MAAGRNPSRDKLIESRNVSTRVHRVGGCGDGGGAGHANEKVEREQVYSGTNTTENKITGFCLLKKNKLTKTTRFDGVCKEAKENSSHHQEHVLYRMRQGRTYIPSLSPAKIEIAGTQQYHIKKNDATPRMLDVLIPGMAAGSAKFCGFCGSTMGAAQSAGKEAGAASAPSCKVDGEFVPETWHPQNEVRGEPVAAEGKPVQPVQSAPHPSLTPPGTFLVQLPPNVTPGMVRPDN
jgi:hypothetical protein